MPLQHLMTGPTTMQQVVVQYPAMVAVEVPAPVPVKNGDVPGLVAT